MRFKLDEHIAQQLSPVLAALGHDARTVVDQGLTGHADQAIWRAVSQEDRLLVTQDLASHIVRDPNICAGSPFFAARA